MKRLIATLFLVAAGCGGTDDALPPGDVASGTVDDAVEDAATPGAGEDIAGADAAAPDVAAVDVLPPPDLGAASDTGADGSAAEDVADDPPDVAPPVDAAAADSSAEDAAGDVAAEDVGPLSIAEKCFPGVNAPGALAPQYDPLNPIMGSHCYGTNHQAITGVQQVVFLGDSVTVGTPNDEHLIPTENDHYYRNQLAEWLATTFNLDKGNLLDWGAWKSWDYIGFSGKGMRQTSGAFSNCSKFGARTDDLMTQLGECFPTGGSDKKTLVVFTMGGNDVASITQSGGNATPEEVAAGYPEAWQLTHRTIEYLEEAIVWLKDPARFPNGVYVVFANPFEFTDGTGTTSACKPQQIQIPFVGAFDLSMIDINMAEVSGFKEWANKNEQKAMVVWMLNEYMRVATTYQVDLMLMLEHFCGHGYVATGPNADPSNGCYEGPDATLWFDITCFHPSEAGHTAIAQMFEAIIAE